MLAENHLTPPVQDDQQIDTPRDLAMEKQSLTEKNVNSSRGAAPANPLQPMKENTAPEK